MSVNDTALVDISFWIALFDPSDEKHADANRNGDLIELFTVVIPWPIVYETLYTRFVRRPDWVVRLDERLKKPNTVFIDDRDYREEAYSLAVEHSTRLRRPISMVDMLCRLLIADPQIRIDYLLTFNPKDFHDLCRRHRVEMWNLSV
jgi:predicted nucleic acid-binding protein